MTGEVHGLTRFRRWATALVLAVLGSSACGEVFVSCPGEACGGETGSGGMGGDARPAGGRRGDGGLGGVVEGAGGLLGLAGNVEASSGGSASGGENFGGACGDSCGESAPYCIEAEATCVECKENEHCEKPNRPLCGSTRTCGRCKTNEDCAQAFPTRPLCVTTVGHEDYGSCVGCFDEDDCDGNVCDPETHECTNYRYRSTSVCNVCVHDLQCKEGLYCVLQNFGPEAMGHFCTQTKESRVGPEGTCGGDPKGAPFTETQELTSIGGEKAEFCLLHTTTCPAYLDYGSSKEGCDDESLEADAACGAPDVADGICRKKPDSTAFFCTYACSLDTDCPRVGSLQRECLEGPDGFCAP